MSVTVTLNVTKSVFVMTGAFSSTSPCGSWILVEGFCCEAFGGVCAGAGCTFSNSFGSGCLFVWSAGFCCAIDVVAAANVAAMMAQKINTDNAACLGDLIVHPR